MQCFKFNEEWKFEKLDRNSQLKAFQGEKSSIQVTLPYDVVLEFEGIYGTARVWINGGLAHTNRNGYMGFMIDLKPWLLYGQENIIKIDVDNSCQPNSRWYTGSGIYRDVNLFI